MDEAKNSNDFIFYQSERGRVEIQVIMDDKNETVWASQKAIAGIFGVSKPTVSEHLANIFKTGELEKGSVVRKIRTTASDGKNYLVEYHNLDAIISVGYRVNSVEATAFRKWATNTLREYLVKGFSLDDERLKQGGRLFGRDYFAELLERIREIRASERLFYQKITDIYMTAVDYDARSPLTRAFFKTVQNKLHWAIAHRTAAEIISDRHGLDTSVKVVLWFLGHISQNRGNDLRESVSRLFNGFGAKAKHPLATEILKSRSGFVF